MPEMPEQEAHATALDVRGIDEGFFIERLLPSRRTLRIVRRSSRTGCLLLQQQLGHRANRRNVPRGTLCNCVHSVISS